MNPRDTVVIFERIVDIVSERRGHKTAKEVLPVEQEFRRKLYPIAFPFMKNGTAGPSAGKDRKLN